MNFEDFLRWSHEAAAAIPGLRLRSETRIATAYAALRPAVEVPATLPRVHRCDLAKQWCELQGWPGTWSIRALVCEGVRHALELLLRRFAQRGIRVTLPSDVYPVYWQIAAAAGVETLGVETFPDFDPAALLAAADSAGSLAVVLPAPLKLHGRPWTETEAGLATAWLGRNGARRMVLDGVYAFGRPPDAAMRRLLDTGQVIYLNSLSKGWLYPRQFGVALLPECEVEDCAEDFRQLQLPQAQLFLAQQLLSHHYDFPRQLGEAIADRRTAFLDHARKTGLPVADTTDGYLIAVQRSSEDLLRKDKLLTIPAKVFGSARTDWSIVSVLPQAAT